MRQVLGMLDAAWESDAGQDVADLEDHLERIFDLYERIDATVSDLKANALAGTTISVTYRVRISGRLPDARDAQHVEQGTVTDILRPDGKSYRIVRTGGKGFF